jgi:hypothetical protein
MTHVPLTLPETPRTDPENYTPRIAESLLNALPQVSGTVSHVLSGQDLFVILVLVLVLVAVLVIFPAVWSSKPYRRKSALAVLDRIIRWRW